MPAPERKPRAIFFGTPDFAVPCLAALLDVAEVVLVISQPDRPQGRGLQVIPTPVKQLALQHELPVLQPTKVRTPEFAAELRALEADVAVVVAYGRILPPAVLHAPRLGCVNVHASLLPELRGAAPIQWSILRGHTRTGVCLMQMDEGMDTGAVLARRELDIGPEETSGELSPRLSALGAQLVREELPRFLRGELQPVPQDHARATLAPMLSKDLGRVRFQEPAATIKNLVRGASPWPGAFAFLGGQRIRLHRVRVLDADAVAGTPGTIVRADAHGIEIACGRGILAIDELQPEGKKRMTAEQFCAGRPALAGQRFEETTA